MGFLCIDRQMLSSGTLDGPGTLGSSVLAGGAAVERHRTPPNLEFGAGRRRRAGASCSCAAAPLRHRRRVTSAARSADRLRGQAAAGAVVSEHLQISPTRTSMRWCSTRPTIKSWASTRRSWRLRLRSEPMILVNPRPPLLPTRTVYVSPAHGIVSGARAPRAATSVHGRRPHRRGDLAGGPGRGAAGRPGGVSAGRRVQAAAVRPGGAAAGSVMPSDRGADQAIGIIVQRPDQKYR